MKVSFPQVPPGEEVRISATTYVTWKKCPESANARLQGEYGPDSRASFLGSLAHQVFRRHLTEGPISDADFDQVCRKEIGSSNLNHRVGQLLKPSELKGVIEEVRALYDRFTTLSADGFEGAEVAIDHETDEGLRLVGAVDAVFRSDLGGHRLVDWKTGELRDAVEQMDFYAFLWALDRDELPAQVEAVSIKTGERHSAVPATSDMKRVATDVGELATEMRRGWASNTSLERRGGPWCFFCPVLSTCAEGQATEALLGGATPP